MAGANYHKSLFGWLLYHTWKLRLGHDGGDFKKSKVAGAMTTYAWSDSVIVCPHPIEHK